MTKFAKIAVALAAVLLWGQVQFVRGFDTGSDTSLCIWTSMIDHKAGKDIPACQRIWMSDPSHYALRLWRKASGDAVPNT